MHKVEQSFDDLIIGSEIKVKDIHYTTILKSKDSDVLTVEFVNTFTQTTHTREVPYSLYEYTPMYSPENKLRDDKWSACEKQYGITYHGANDPDELRRLAFKILRGESEAIDIAMDVIKRGG